MKIKTVAFINLICIFNSCQILDVLLPTVIEEYLDFFLSFYSIPSGDPEKEKGSRLKWLNTICRDKWSKENICIAQPSNQSIDFLNNDYTELKWIKTMG